MSEKHLLRNAMDFYCLFCNSKRTPYAQTPTKSLERILSKLLFGILNARSSQLKVHLLLQTCVYFVNSPLFRSTAGTQKLSSLTAGTAAGKKASVPYCLFCITLKWNAGFDGLVSNAETMDGSRARFGRNTDNLNEHRRGSDGFPVRQLRKNLSLFLPGTLIKI